MEPIYTIKPLAWVDLPEINTQRANMPNGFYEVWHCYAGYAWSYTIWNTVMSANFDFAASEEAKAAAEAHYLNMVKRFLNEETERVVILATDGE